MSNLMPILRPRFILVTREQLLLEVIHDNSNGFPTSTREDTTNCRAKAVPLRDTPTMTIGLGITATLAKRVGMNLFQAPCLDGPRELQVPQEREAPAWRATTTPCHHPASRACTPARCRAARTVLARARPLRRPPTTPPLVLLMPPALNPPEPKLPPGLPTLEQLLKGLTRPTWGARAIHLPRRTQTAGLPPSKRHPRRPYLHPSTPG